MNGRFLRAEVTAEEVKALGSGESDEDYPGFSRFDLQTRRSMLASLRTAGIVRGGVLTVLSGLGLLTVRNESSIIFQPPHTHDVVGECGQWIATSGPASHCSVNILLKQSQYHDCKT